MLNMTPQQIVVELDKYIIGQDDAKRAVAVAIRNRWRRRKLDEEIAREVYPKNIIMIGPTGVGKTEIARRLAKLTGAPFIKVEASKFTEVGYHGRDVESMIRDLLDQAINMVREEMAQEVCVKATASANERIVDLLLPGFNSDVKGDSGYVPMEQSEERRNHTRLRLIEQVKAGRLDAREIELTLNSKPQASMMFASMGLDQMDPDMANMFERMIPEQSQTRKMVVSEARKVLIEQETDKLLDKDKITAEAINRTENSGIVFLDEIDKIATGSGGGKQGGPDISRQGVQRDLLPVVEGSVVTTRYGSVHTDHILFIAAGAFHVASVSDLMPELQGRFPIRVELSPLTREDFVRILTEPDNALTKQQQALLGVEGLTVSFDDNAIDAIAQMAAQANTMLENIGARRLMTIIEKVFEEVNFDASERVARGDTTFTMSESFVREQVAAIVQDEDLSKFVL
ncbi:MAG: ATP-dependent protease ATPase subunit HslU [Phycisphaeraceae bacterium]|nr:ATP-dependent protease ATPase subunit HslU [Phycisphaeraceae bacterium]